MQTGRQLINKSLYKTKYHKGFTLPEFLITLAIIGVVVAMTIPLFSQAIQDNQYKIAYKKAYSIASQAWTELLSDNQIVSRTTWCDAAPSLANFNAFKAKFNVIKQCSGADNISDCWAAGEKYWNEPSNSTNNPTFIDNSGVIWVGKRCGDFLVDTNGFKGPNQLGKDRFVFSTQVSSGNINTPGIPNIITTSGDYTSVDANSCPNPPCYYRSWITNSK